MLGKQDARRRYGRFCARCPDDVHVATPFVVMADGADDE